MCARVCSGMHAWMWVFVCVCVCRYLWSQEGVSHLGLDLHAVWISWCRCGNQSQILYKSSQLSLLPRHFSTPTPIYCFSFLSFLCFKWLFYDSTLSLVFWAACGFTDCFKAVCIYPAQATFKWHSSTSRVAWGLLVFVLEFSCLFRCVTETRDSLVWIIQLSFRTISSHEDGSLSYSCVYCGGGGGARFYA